ncbi:motility associated factor glycosyltransferase family protein [bacterium]|nr:motility associated factor glycosyltransferase family protein [bacterium]
MLQKNLSYINNEVLKNKLEKISINESKRNITYCITPSNDYILLQNDLPLDDVNNPKEAIKQHLKKNIKYEMKSNDIIINFGIGLGYLLDETYNTYPSKIYIYEPDIMLLHFVLSNIDISEHLAEGRVFIYTDLKDLLKKIEETYLTKDKIEVVYLPNYAIIRNKELLELTQKVYDTCQSKLIDLNTITRFSGTWLVNTLNNIASINNNGAYLASDLEKKFISQTALIIGAGPSLIDNIEKIKANRNKYVIFAVNKVVKYLAEKGLVPDFIVCLDAENMEKTLNVPNEYLSKTNCIVDIKADKFVFTKKFNKIFINFSDSDTITQDLAKYNNSVKLYESGGSAATLALVLAVKFGFTKILLAGIDLAFKDSTIYASGEQINRINPEMIKVDDIKKNLVKVKSVKGNEVYTRNDYAVFIKHFETLIKLLGPTEICNLSDFGAEIKGTKNVSFDEINFQAVANMYPVNTANVFKLKIDDYIQNEFFHINNIISILSKGVYSSALVNAIVKSGLIYQYMQKSVILTLQKDFHPDLAETFIEKTKVAIKTVVDILQKNKLI